MGKISSEEIKVAVDAIVFSIVNDELSILLIKRKYAPFEGKYALPGGFVLPDESIKDAVNRELKEETNLTDVFLRHVGTYGDVKRDPRGRVISIAYLALIKADQDLKASTDAQEAKWFSIDSLPEVAFDHKKLIEHGLMQLKFEIQTTNIAREILPERFTLTQLQKLYEVVLQKELDKRNFRKKIKELDIVRETGQMQREGAHRPAMLHEFIDKEYKPISEKMNVFL